MPPPAQKWSFMVLCYGASKETKSPSDGPHSRRRPRNCPDFCRTNFVSLIGIKPIIKCVSQRSCEHVETRPSLSGTGEKFFLDFSSLDKSPEFAYESTSFDYEFVSQPHDG